MLRLAVILFIFALAAPINGQVPAGSPDEGNKCGGCPCNSPCSVPSPPPPPPAMPPPPPAQPPPPPPTPKKPPTPVCPPPPGSSGGPVVPTPPSQYIYITGPPGNLYPVDTNFSRAARSSTVGLPLVLLVGSMLQLALW